MTIFEKESISVETTDIFRPTSLVLEGEIRFPQTPFGVLENHSSSLELEHFLLLKDPIDFYWDMYSGIFKSGIKFLPDSIENFLLNERVSFLGFLERAQNLKEFFSVYHLTQFKKCIIMNPKSSYMRYVGDLRKFEFKDESLYSFYIDFLSSPKTIFININSEKELGGLQKRIGSEINLDIDTKLFDLPVPEAGSKYIREFDSELYKRFNL